MLFDLLLSELRSVNWTQLSTLVMLANICLHESLQAGFKEKGTTTGENWREEGTLTKVITGNASREHFNSCLFGSAEIKVQARSSSVY